MRKNNFPVEKNGENKLNVMNNEINKNKNSNIKLFNFINRYISQKNICYQTSCILKRRLLTA